MLADAGAYGNHGPGVMFHGCGESVAVYRCANKRVDAKSVYTNNLPSGAFRGYGLGQVSFAVESAMDELAAALGIDPFELRRRNVMVPGDPFVAAHVEDDDLQFGSYGLDQCLDLAQAALASGNGVAAPAGAQWKIGEGMAIAMIATIPPRGHASTTSVTLRRRRHVHPRHRHRGVRQRHDDGVPAARRRSVLNTTIDNLRMRQSDTDEATFDTGAFGSTGTSVTGKALVDAAERLRDAILEVASSVSGVPVAACSLRPTGVLCGERIVDFADSLPPTEVRWRPRATSVAFPARLPTTRTRSGWPSTPRPARSGSCKPFTRAMPDG